MLVLWPVHQLEMDHSQYLGIMTISAVLKEHGIPTEVISADLERISERIEGEDDVILAYSTPSAHATVYIELNRQLKRSHPKVLSVFGGTHPTYFPEMVEDEGVDGVCVGEGEYPMLELVIARAAGESVNSLANWWIKDNGTIHRNAVRPLIEDLDELPVPDRGIFRLAANQSISHAIVMTGRGCPYNCSYCFNHVYHRLYAGKGNMVRRRSVDHVMRELRQLKEDGCGFIRFMDDLFILLPEWVQEFARRYREEIGLPFSCLVRANLVTEEIVKSLKEAGCHRIMMGIEAGSERLRLEILKRRMSSEQILEAARIIRGAKIKLVTANILAIPGGSIHEDWETVDLNILARPDYASASVLQAFPGTEIHEIAEHLDLLEDDHLERISQGGFGFTTAMKGTDAGEIRQIENLHKFFPIVVWFPWLKPVVRLLIKLPPNRFFELMYMTCINFGTHFISIPPAIGGPLLWRKLKRRFLPGSRRSAKPAEAAGA